MLTQSEQKVMRTFREFCVLPGQMLCFSGTNLETHTPAINTLVDKNMLVRETFRGGFSLTRSGFAAMRACS